MDEIVAKQRGKTFKCTVLIDCAVFCLAPVIRLGALHCCYHSTTGTHTDKQTHININVQIDAYPRRPARRVVSSLQGMDWIALFPLHPVPAGQQLPIPLGVDMSDELIVELL